jgi:uncharacterized phage protein (TIGR02216 family)
MAFGLGELRLRPADFWRMTPKEFSAAARAPAGMPPMARRALGELMLKFPDQTGDPQRPSPLPVPPPQRGRGR